ncbi:MAG: hypothetical protein H7837_05975 [Magnetococcus sp. MYC-9]
MLSRSYTLEPVLDIESARQAGELCRVVHQIATTDENAPDNPLFNFLQAVGAKPVNGEYAWLLYFAIRDTAHRIVGSVGVFQQNQTYVCDPNLMAAVHTGWVFVSDAHRGLGLATRSVAWMMRLAHRVGFSSFFTLMDTPAGQPPKGRSIYQARLKMSPLEEQNVDPYFVRKMTSLYSGCDLYYLSVPDLAGHQTHIDEVIGAATINRSQVPLVVDETLCLGVLHRTIARAPDGAFA